MTNSIEAKRLEAADGAITYSVAGNGPPVLFLHGLGGNALSWVRQLDALSGEYTVLAWDAPGYGGSAVRVPDVDVYATAAAQLIDALGIAPVSVVGHSMGGIIAGRLVARRPDLVAALVLSSTFVGDGASPDEPLADGFQTRLNELKTLPRDEFAMARAVAMVAPDTAAEIVQAVAEVAAKVNPDGFEHACRMLNSANNRRSLESIRVPVLILEGGADPIVPSDAGDQLAELIPHAERYTLPGIGHAAYLEAPQHYNEVVTGFLRRQRAG